MPQLALLQTTGCIECSRPLPVQPHQGTPRKWCDNACRSRFVRRERRNENPPSTDGTCVVCADPFVLDPRFGRRRRRCEGCQSIDAVAMATCPTCGDIFRAPRHRETCSMSCGQQLRASRTGPRDRPHRGNTYRARALQYGGAVEHVDKRLVFDRDGWLCQLCLMPVDPALSWPNPGSVSLDHIIPLSRGGDHTYLNVQTTHFFCNLSKHAKVA